MKHNLYKVTTYYKKKVLLSCTFYDIKSVLTYLNSCLVSDEMGKDKNFTYIITTMGV